MSTAQTFELLTPCFCAGVNKARPEMRLASVRGQLRWWSRVLHGPGVPEYQVFGGIHGKSHGYSDEGVASSFKFSLTPFANNDADEIASLVPHKPGNGFDAKALPKGSRYTLEWAAQAHPDFRDKSDEMFDGQTRRQLLERAAKAWLLLGTLGRRGTRAAGSVWPVNYAPTLENFNTSVSELGLPPTVRVAALNAVPPNPNESAETLRAIADKTVHKLKRDTARLRNDEISFSGNPLGYVDGANRKASPLRFKVGKFEDGYRLIAVWDNRNGRGGRLADAIAKMNADHFGRELAIRLTAAGF